MKRILVKGVGGWPQTLVDVVANYGYDQSLWKRLLAVVAWSKSADEKSELYWRQFEIFVQDPDPRVRIAAIDHIHYLSHGSEHFWAGLATASIDPIPDVRQAISEVWRSEFLRPFPRDIWRVINQLLSDPSEKIRANVLLGLKTQKVWPLEIWRKIPSLLNTDRTNAAALEAVAEREWPREIWKSIPSVLNPRDLQTKSLATNAKFTSPDNASCDELLNSRRGGVVSHN